MRGAEGAEDEAPKAPKGVKSGETWEGLGRGCPPHQWGWGLGRGCAPVNNFFWKIHVEFIHLAAEKRETRCL